jgi:hypothetical protein
MITENCAGPLRHNIPGVASVSFLCSTPICINR